MKRRDFYVNNSAYNEIRMARAFRQSANVAKMFGANAHLVALYREWMRSHATLAVKLLRIAKTP